MRNYLITGLATIGLLFASTVSAQDNAAHPRAITVRGEAKEKVAPDQATVNFSIVTRSKDPNLARSLNAEAGSKIVAKIEALGVPSEAIRLQNLILNPAREWNPDRRTYIELGYDVTRSVEVTLEDLTLVGDVVVGVVESGANRLEGVQYGLKSETELRTRVLSSALMAAKDRAAAMVAAIGAELGEVLTISEEAMSMPMPYYGAERMMVQKAASDESQALPEGQIEVSATVSATFAIR